MISDNYNLQNKSINNWYKLMLILLGFLSVQRNFLPSIYPFVCVPLFVFGLLLMNRNRCMSISLIISSLLLSVDLGGDVYATTPNFIRYPIYIISIIMLFKGKLPKFSFWFVFSLFLVTLLTTFFLQNQIDFITLARDIFIIIIAFGFLSKTNVTPNLFSYNILFLVFLGYVAGEFFNSILIGWNDNFDYQSYDSTKSIIVFPFFYLYLRKKYLPAIILFIITSIVLIFFGTRMLIISFYLLILLLSIGIIFKSVSSFLISSFIIFSFVYTFNYLNFDLNSSRVSSFFITILSDGDFIELIKSIDRVRFIEHELFFSRNFFEILFGSGLGSGLEDVDGKLQFIKQFNWRGAFTKFELSTNYYYNLHDTWIDIGLRLGLLPVILLYLFLFKNLLSANKPRVLLSCVCFVLLNCASFSTSGLIIIAFFIKSLISFRENHEKSLV